MSLAICGSRTRFVVWWGAGCSAAPIQAYVTFSVFILSCSASSSSAVASKFSGIPIAWTILSIYSRRTVPDRYEA